MLSSVSSSSGKKDLNYHIRQVRNSLKHFNDVVAKNKLEMLPGNGTVILENLTDVHTALQMYALNERSSALISAKRQVHAALGALIKLCDEFWLHELKFKSKADEVDGVVVQRVSSDMKQMKVKEVTELMEAALTNLIQVSHEKLQEQNAAKGAFPVGLITTTDQNDNLLQRPVVDVASQRTSLPDIPLTPRERDILQSKANHHNLVRGSHSIESVLCEPKNCNAQVMRSDSPSPLPPPKPPLPNRLSDAPPLPPKRKAMQLLQQQFSHPVVVAAAAANLEAEFMAPLERTSWRSKSPEDNSSLLSVSAGSLDSSTLNQSREEDLFEMDQLAATSSTSSSKSPSQFQYQQLEEQQQGVNQLAGRLPTVSVTGTGGEGLMNGNANDTRYFVSGGGGGGENGEVLVTTTTTTTGSNNTRITETRHHQQHQNTFTQSSVSMSTRMQQQQQHQQTFTNSRTQFSDRFQTLYSSANVRVRVLPLSVSQDGFLGTTATRQQQQLTLLGMNGNCGQLMSHVAIGDSCTLTRRAEVEGQEEKVQNRAEEEQNRDEEGQSTEEDPPKLPEKQRKNSTSSRHKSVYDNMSPRKGGGGEGATVTTMTSDCDAVDSAVEFRDK